MVCFIGDVMVKWVDTYPVHRIIYVKFTSYENVINYNL